MNSRLAWIIHIEFLASLGYSKASQKTKTNQLNKQQFKYYLSTIWLMAQLDICFLLY